jgi:ABC-type transporter MlaC component
MAKALTAWLMLTAATAAPATPREAVQSLRSCSTTQQEARLDRAETGEACRRWATATPRTKLQRFADRFDLEEMARRVLSLHWAKRSPAEQAEAVHLVASLLERSSVGKLTAYPDHKVAYLGESVDGDYGTVRSRVAIDGRSSTVVDYRLHRTEGRWRIYDVLVDGVSFVSTYRNEVDRAIRSASYASMIDRVRKGGTLVASEQ